MKYINIIEKNLKIDVKEKIFTITKGDISVIKYKFFKKNYYKPKVNPEILN